MLGITKEEAKLLYAVMGYVRVDNDMVASLNTKLKGIIVTGKQIGRAHV